MNDDFNKELCEEKHKNLHELLEKIDKNISILFVRLNWFYACVIGCLVAVVAKGCIK